MLRSRIPELAAVGITIASVIGLTGLQAQEAAAVPRTVVASHSKAAHTTESAAASTAASEPAAKRLAQVKHADVANSCPSRTVCAFPGHNWTGTPGDIPTADYHSRWIDFDSVVGFHPNSLIDNSGSDIWVIDRQSGVFACILGGDEADFEGWQPGWFFIQYNVNTCATQPSGL